MSAPTALYRHFDGDGRLLYVGISLSAVMRLARHASGSHWSQDIRRVDVEMFPAREDAEAAERRAIYDEHPAHNLAGNACFRGGTKAGGSNALDAYIRASGLKAGDLARAVGITDQHLSKLRNGKIRPSIGVALALAKATGGAVPVETWEAERAA